mgnify:CR=1 FL=1
MAAVSVLKPVRIIQKIGKKMTTATDQPNTVSKMRLLRAERHPDTERGAAVLELNVVIELLPIAGLASAGLVFQVFGHHADQEDRHDIRQDDGNHPTGGRHTYVKIQQCTNVNQIG